MPRFNQENDPTSQRRWLQILATGVIVLMSVTGCGTRFDTREPPSQARDLTVNLGLMRPLIYPRNPKDTSDASSLTGLEYEILQSFARVGGYSLSERRITDVSMKLAGVMAGDVDLAIGAIDITAEREKKVRFTRATVVSGKTILVRNGDPMATDIRSHWDLIGRPVGTKHGTTSVDLLKEIGAEITEAPTFEEALNLLRQQRVVAVVFDAPVVWDYAARDEAAWTRVVGDLFNPVGYGIAVDPRQPELLEELNRFLDTYVESPEYKRFLDQFLGKSKGRRTEGG